jgi:hypothetical protein
MPRLEMTFCDDKSVEVGNRPIADRPPAVLRGLNSPADARTRIATRGRLPPAVV